MRNIPGSIDTDSRASGDITAQGNADPIGNAMPDTPSANGTLTEALAWQAGVPAPRWYRYNQTDLATAVFRDKVLGESDAE